jgi:hypothetical protein
LKGLHLKGDFPHIGAFVLDTKKDFSKLYIGGWALILSSCSNMI